MTAGNVILAVLFVAFIVAMAWTVIRMRNADKKAQLARREKEAANYAAIREQWKQNHVGPARPTGVQSYHRAGKAVDIPKPAPRTKPAAPKKRAETLADTDDYSFHAFGYADYSNTGSSYSSNDSGSSSSSSYDSGSSSSSSDSGSSGGGCD